MTGRKRRLPERSRAGSPGRWKFLRTRIAAACPPGGFRMGFYRPPSVGSKDLISSMLLAFAVAIISDISIIQWPCSLRYTLSSSSLRRSSENHSSFTASSRKRWIFRLLTAHQTEHDLKLAAGMKRPVDGSQQKQPQGFIGVLVAVGS